ncbi:MAG: glycosyltransferase family 4 protein, partial [Chloroflexota bacterium]
RHQLALLRASDVVFAQTPIEVEFLTRIGVAPQRIVLAGVGVEPSEVTGGDAQRFRQLLGTDAPIVLALGTQTADKGTLHLIAAMQTLWAAGSGAHLALVGTAMREVKQALDALPASVRVHTHLLGSVSDETKRDALAACALLALPSRTDSFGIVLLEAWLNTKPVVGARAGGIPAIIDDGCDGLLVPFGDVPALADAIQQLLNNETLRAAFGQAGRAKTLAHYTWDTIYPVIRETYERFDTSRVPARGTYNG